MMTNWIHKIRIRQYPNNTFKLGSGRIQIYKGNIRSDSDTKSSRSLIQNATAVKD